MNPETLGTILVYGFTTSLVYALFAEGFSLIFGVARMIDAAYGMWYAAAAYMAYALVTTYNVPVAVNGCRDGGGPLRGRPPLLLVRPKEN
jgi:branched-subunit amino acid ABC-type transport system permease component